MYRIAVIPGDGTGPEVVREGLKVLEAVAAAEEFGLLRDRRSTTWAASAICAPARPCRIRCSRSCGDSTPSTWAPSATRTWQPGILETGILLRLRFELDQYINLRPVKLYPGVDCPLKDKGPEDIDFVVVRENTEGLYGGMGGVPVQGHAARGRRRRSI